MAPPHVVCFIITCDTTPGSSRSVQRGTTFSVATTMHSSREPWVSPLRRKTPTTPRQTCNGLSCSLGCAHSAATSRKAAPPPNAMQAWLVKTHTVCLCCPRCRCNISSCKQNPGNQLHCCTLALGWRVNRAVHGAGDGTRNDADLVVKPRALQRKIRTNVRVQAQQGSHSGAKANRHC